jgi:hypothetical protein
MEHIQHLDQLQTNEEKAKYMDEKFRPINGKINGESDNRNTRMTYGIFYGAIIYGPRPLKMIRTKTDLQEFKTVLSDFLTIEQIINLIINGNLWSKSKTPAETLYIYRAITIEIFHKHFSNEKKNPIYYFYLEYKKLTPVNKMRLSNIYDTFIYKENQPRSYTNNDKPDKYTSSRAEGKLRYFLHNEKIKLMKGTEQKRTLRGFLCGCGGAYQTPGNDRHFLTAKHIKYAKEMKIHEQKIKIADQKRHDAIYNYVYIEPEPIKRIYVRKPVVLCECGGSYTKDKPRHDRTKLHRDYITNGPVYYTESDED